MFSSLFPLQLLGGDKFVVLVDVFNCDWLRNNIAVLEWPHLLILVQVGFILATHGQIEVVQEIVSDGLLLLSDLLLDHATLFLLLFLVSLAIYFSEFFLKLRELFLGKDVGWSGSPMEVAQLGDSVN